MSNLVDPDDCERIVGERHEFRHIIKLVAEEEFAYLLHSEMCRDEYGQALLTECPFSVAMDHGLDPERFVLGQSTFVYVDDDGHLAPWSLSFQTRV